MEQRKERSLRVAPCLGKQMGSTAGALTLGDSPLSGIIDYFSLCGVLNEKFHHGLKCLNTWSPVGRIVWGGYLRDMALVEKIHQCR